MENQLMNNMFPASVFLLLVIFIEYSWRKSKSRKTSRNLPPGPWKLPIIGNMHQLVGSMPHLRLMELAKKHGPIMHLQLGHISTIVISSSEIAKQILKTHDLVFASRPFNLAARIIAYDARGVAFGPYGDYWRQVKKICTQELLSAKRVKSFRSIREEEVSHLIKSLASSGGAPVNLTSIMIDTLYCITSRTALGNVPKQQIKDFHQVVSEILRLGGGFNVADMFPSLKFLQVVTGMRSKFRKLHQEADAALEEIIREHKERTKFDNTVEDNLISVLLNLQETGMLDIPLTKEDIKAVLLDMLLGGYDPSVTAVDWTMAELVKHPNILERAQKEVRQIFNKKERIDEDKIHDLPYLNSVIKEALRLHPPGPLLLPREAREKAEICGYEIPEKTQIIVNAQAISRDPERWSEPNLFDPKRFLNSSIDYKGTDLEFTPFGAGRRMCPGIHFATSMIQVVLANLLYHFDWQIPDAMNPEDLDMSEVFGVTVNRKNDLFLILVPYAPL